MVTNDKPRVNPFLSTTLNMRLCRFLLEETHDSNSLEGQPDQQQQQQQQPPQSGRPDNLVAFRIRPEQLAFFRRLADFLYQNGFIQEPTLSRMAYMCAVMIGKKFEKQEAANLERYVNKRLADARAEANPRFRDEQFHYAQGQPQQQQPSQPQGQPAPQPCAPSGSTIPPSLRKPRVIPPINDEWLWQDSNQQEGVF
jgi:hypothetical protein